MAQQYKQVEYNGPDGYVQDEVAPYNGEKRRLSKGDSFVVPEELANYLNIFEGFTVVGDANPDEDPDEAQEKAHQEAVQKLSEREGESELGPAQEEDATKAEQGGDSEANEQKG